MTNKNAEKISYSNEFKFTLIQNTVNNSRFQTDELLKSSIEIQNALEDAILLEKKLYSQICNDINKSSQDVYVISKKK